MLKQLALILILLLPVLHPYQFLFFPTSIGEVLLFTVLVGHLLKVIITKKLRIHVNKFNKLYMLFLLFFVFQTLVFTLTKSDYFSITESFNSIIRLYLYGILIMLFSWGQNPKFFLKWYKRLCIIFVSYFYLQIIFHYSMGVDLTAINIPGLMWIEEPMLYVSGYFYRPASLFMESSWFALYVLPMFMYLTLVTKDYKWSLFMGISLLFSTSNFALLGIGITFLCMFIIILSKKTLKTQIQISVLIILIAILLVILYNIGIFKPILNRLLAGGSMNSRFLSGLLIFNQLNLFDLFFGVGFGNIEHYAMYHNLNVSLSEKVEYTATLFYILISAGLVGVCLFLRWILVYVKRLTVTTLGFYLLFLMLILFDACILMPQYLLYVFIMNIVILSYSKRGEIKYAKNNLNLSK